MELERAYQFIEAMPIPADAVCLYQLISILIMSSVIPLLRNSAEILLQRVPRSHEHDIKLAVDQVLRMKGKLLDAGIKDLTIQVESVISE
ncbi:hypothetical protein Droror1_Dr00006173 [Drosera rotundifolia]